jgi:hypothetical protein
MSNTDREKSKLELTWLGNKSPFGREPRIRIELADDPSNENSPVRCQEALMHVCGNPRCGCLDIWFAWLSAPANALAAPVRPPGSFWFNLSKMSVSMTPELERDPAALRLGEILRSELTPIHQQQLFEWYQATKLVTIRATPVDKIDITGLPDVRDGNMIAFTAVFPCGMFLDFEWNQEFWAVTEQYCVNPECGCNEARLTFFKLKGAAGRQTLAIKNPPSLLYNYHTAAVRPDAGGTAEHPSPDELLGTLKYKHPTLNSQLEARHLVMKKLYLRQHLAPSRTQIRSLSDPPGGTQKISRNAPCPCGSGRKYKHCCLNKPPS